MSYPIFIRVFDLKESLLFVFILIMLFGSYPTNTFTQDVHLLKRYNVTDGLNQRIVKRIIRDKYGRFWVFTEEGVQFYNGSSFKNIPELIDFPFEKVDKIELLQNGNIGLKSESVFFELDIEKLQVNQIQTSSTTKAIFLQDEICQFNLDAKTISINDKEISLDYDPKKLERWNSYVVSLDSLSNLHFINQNEHVHLIPNVDQLIGALRDKLLFIKGNTLYAIDDQFQVDFLYGSTTKAIVRRDTLSNYLLGISDHSKRIKEFYLYTRDSICDLSFLTKPYNTIQDFYGEDFRSEILMATYEGLIYQAYGKQIERIDFKPTVEEGGFGEVIWWSFYRERDNATYFANESEGLFKYQNDTVTQVFPNDVYTDAFKSKSYLNYFGKYDPEDDLLLSASYGQSGRPNYLWIWTIEKDLRYIHTDIRIRNMIKRNSGKYILVGSKKEEAHISVVDTKNLVIKEERSIPEIGNSIYNLEFDQESYVVSTNTGLFRLNFRENTFSENPISIDTIYQADLLDHLTIGEYTLAGSHGDGLFLFQHDTLVRQINSSHGLAGNTPHTIRFLNGNYWINTLKGISVLDEQFNLVKNIRRREGLSSLDINISSFSSDGNHVYIGTINGLNKINMDIIHDKRRFTVVPEAIHYQYQQGNFSKKLSNLEVTIPFGIDNCYISVDKFDLFTSGYHNNDLMFLNSSIIDGERVNIQDDKISLINPGNVTDICIQSPAFIKQCIVVKRNSFFQQFDAEILLVLLALSLLFALYKSNEKSLIEKNKQEVGDLNNRLEAMRSSALRSQMNPHFIFNALSSIQYFIQKEEIESAEEYLSDFAFLMRRILESSKEDYVKLSEEVDMIKAYLKLEHIRFDDKFDYFLELESSLDLNSEIPSMIIQPFIENAINHGIYHLEERKGQLSIKFIKGGEEQLLCHIEDNGIGRVNAKKLSQKKHKSRSMEIVKDRMSILANSANQTYTVHISDKYLNNEPAGTSVKLAFSIE